MNLVSKFALLTLAFATPAYAATWTPVVRCEDGHMVVDRDENISSDPSRGNFQLVLRDIPEVIGYLKLSALTNARGEFVIPVGPVGQGDDSYPQREFAALIEGQTYVLVSKLSENGDGVRVSVVQSSYRSEVIKELAHWDFYGCN